MSTSATLIEESHSFGAEQRISRPVLRVGLSKAAVFVLALEESVASQLLQSLSDEDLGNLTREIARLGVVDQKTLSFVLREFHDLTQIHGVLKEGGLDQAIRLLERSFSPERSRRLIQLLEAHRPHLPLAFLSGAETNSLLVLLEGEHPQTVAVVLAHMTPSKAAEVLEKMDALQRKDLIRRIASLQGTHEEVIEQLEKSLREHLDTSTLALPQQQRGGVEVAAGILRAASSGGRDFLGDLRSDQPELVDAICRRLFVFEDIIHLDDRAVQKILQAVERKDLILALKNASTPLKEKIFKNVSTKDGEKMILEEMELLSPVRVADIETARQSIVETILELENSRAIEIRGRRARETGLAT